MGVKVEGLLGTEDMLLTVDTRVKKRVVRKLIAAGKDLKRIAKMMAPVDEGNLEAAIKMRPEEYNGRERDTETGTFLRTEVEVYVDMDMPVPERPNKTVGDYAYEAHEHITPMGHKNLGDKSNEKQLGTPEVVVGGGFMTRAAQKIEDGIDDQLRAALDEALAGF